MTWPLWDINLLVWSHSNENLAFFFLFWIIFLMGVFFNRQKLEQHFPASALVFLQDFLSLSGENSSIAERVFFSSYRIECCKRFCPNPDIGYINVIFVCVCVTELYSCFLSLTPANAWPLYQEPLFTQRQAFQGSV